ncbi:MAG: hypothetical protein VYD57_18805 [Pseudomonadota bacterium]|nr:hypothetical protein [Pseudomonadota bacterium]
MTKHSPAGIIPASVEVFAQIKLIARAGSRINIACAYSKYERFTRGRGGKPISAASFGAGLTAVARGAGGMRDDDVVTNLAWLENRHSLLTLNGAAPKGGEQ